MFYVNCSSWSVTTQQSSSHVYNYCIQLRLPNSPLSPNKNKVKTLRSHGWPLLSQRRRRVGSWPTPTTGKVAVTIETLSSAAGKRHVVPSTAGLGSMSYHLQDHTETLPNAILQALCVHASSSLLKDRSFSFPGLGAGVSWLYIWGLTRRLSEPHPCD